MLNLDKLGTSKQKIKETKSFFICKDEQRSKVVLTK